VRLGIVAALALASGWGAWFVRARVPIYAHSDKARVEVVDRSHPVDAPAPGQVKELRLALGAEVHAGDVLVVLDSTADALALAEARAKAAGLAPQIDATRAEIASEDRALGAHKQGLGAQLSVAQGRLDEAKAAAAAARDEADRAKALLASGSLARAEYVRIASIADQRAAAAAAARADMWRVSRDSSVGARDRETRMATLRRELARLESDASQAAATIDSLQHVVERKTIRATLDGTVAELSNVRVGASVGQGERIATIMAGGNLRAVAEFVPADAVGRVRAGQRAELRLDGFPWTEFGAIPAKVTQVANEVRDGKTRVELVLLPPEGKQVPLQHGLPGTIEITVDEVSPAALVLRAAGRPGA
jgi:membrane fusion protein (multidrug efflux system)